LGREKRLRRGGRGAKRERCLNKSGLRREEKLEKGQGVKGKKAKEKGR
jgi:hypothetical protein